MEGILEISHGSDTSELLKGYANFHLLNIVLSLGVFRRGMSRSYSFLPADVKMAFDHNIRDKVDELVESLEEIQNQLEAVLSE